MNPLSTSLIGFTAVFCCFPGSLLEPGQDQQPAVVKKLVFEAGEYRAIDLLDASAKFLDCTYLTSFSARKTQAGGSLGPQIELKKDLVLNRADCEEVLTRILYSKDLGRVVVDQEKRIFEWVSLNSPQRNRLKTRSSFVSVEKILSERGLQEVVRTMMVLKNVDPRSMASTLRPILADPTGFQGIHAIGDSRVMVIMGFRDFVRSMVEMVQKIDAAGAAQAKSRRSLASRVKKLELRVEELEQAGVKKD